MKPACCAAICILMGLVIFWSGCQENDADIKPEISLVITPGASGLTTDVFTFDARSTINPAGGGKLYFRWNYGEETGWDSPLSMDQIKMKRFLKPGKYVITVLALNSKGYSDTTYFDVTIGQGRSSPRPVIRMTPETGHFLTAFRFDAMLTRDDEDSLSTLKFRWDFNGDGRWDTGFDTATSQKFVFGAEGDFEPVVEVLDPAGLKAVGQTKVSVTSMDPEIIPDFYWTPADGEVGDTILFDGSKSHHLTSDTMTFKYSWRLERGEGWTPVSESPTISYRFRTNLDQEVILKVIDQRGLFNTLHRPIHLDPENFPPVAMFDVSVPYGNIRTQFRLNAWNCSDDHDTTSSLLVRWDFNGDKVWDTGYSTEKLLFHQYPAEGSFDLTMEVMDSKGLTSIYSRKILVSPWENETGILWDSRDMQYYGTVKIGERWWMAENLKYNFHKYNISHLDMAPDNIMFPSLALNEQQSLVETYGRFYYVLDAVPDRSAEGEDYAHALCPNGWSIPTKEEWEQLIADTHAESQPENLILGGNSDFNATFMGYADYVFVRSSSGQVKDTIFTFRDTFKKAWFFSVSQPKDENRVDLFMVKIDRNGPALWTGWDGLRYYIPVRCIRVK
jgi:uncharacterized protein (TIGR02145 family)